MTKMMMNLVIAKIRELSDEEQLTVINGLKASMSEDDLIAVEKLKASLVASNKPTEPAMLKRQ